MYGTVLNLTTAFNSRQDITSLKYANSQAQPLWSKAYSWDRNGVNLLSVTDQISGNVRQFSYDYVNRLASTTDATGGVADTYTMDAWGNRQESGTYNFTQPFSAVNQINATGYVYDLSGNMTADGLGNTYSYDADGKMSASNGAVYTRDSFGQRVRKDYSGAATEYFYFGGELLATRDPSSSHWTDYIYAGGRLIAEIPVTSTDTPFYRIGDHLDSLAQKTDSAGNLLGTNDVSPYGELFSSTASDRLMFTQHERDTENSSDSALYRQYASTQGRWLSPDPYNGSYDLTDPQSLNRYAYLAGRPLAAVDSLGLDSFWDSVLEVISVGQYDPPDSKGTKGSSPAEEGYGVDGVANPGRPFNLSVTGWGYDGSSGFNTYLLGAAASLIPTGGAQGAQGQQRQRNPNGQECKALAAKIGNIVADIQSSTSELATNPYGLPDAPPFPGAPRKLSVQGHRELLDEKIQNLANRAHAYNQKCGGGDPFGGGSAATSTSGASSPAPIVSPTIKQGLIVVGGAIIVGGTVILCPECLSLAPALVF